MLCCTKLLKELAHPYESTTQSADRLLLQQQQLTFIIVEVLTLLRNGVYPQISAKLMGTVAFTAFERQAPDAKVWFQ